MKWKFGLRKWLSTVLAVQEDQLRDNETKAEERTSQDLSLSMSKIHLTWLKVVIQSTSLAYDKYLYSLLITRESGTSFVENIRRFQQSVKVDVHRTSKGAFHLE